MTRRAVVTGGCGFIGSHLVERLLKDGWSVRVVDDFSTGNLNNLISVLNDVELFTQDVSCLENLSRVMGDTEVVFHMAGMASVPGSITAPLKSHSVNATGTLNVLQAAREAGVKRVVLSSSASVYGNADQLPTTEQAPICPQSPYAADKAAAESYCRVFNSLYEIEAVVLRYFNVFGPRQNVRSGYAAVIPRFVQAAVTHSTPTVFGDGLQTRDFVCVDNVVSANILAATVPGVGGETFNVAGGSAISLLDLLSTLRTITGLDLEPVFQPGLSGEVRHSYADITRAREMLGYSPTVSLEEGLRRTLEHTSGQQAE